MTYTMRREIIGQLAQRCGKTPPISGWTPEGQAQLYARLEAKGLPVIDYREVVDWAAQMRRLNSPMIFKRENWGLAELDLGETILPSPLSSSRLI